MADQTNLTLDLGLRYEMDDIRDPIRTDKNNFAPRVAFAWDVRGDHQDDGTRRVWNFLHPSNYAIVQVANALGEVNGKRQIAQVLTSIGTPGAQSAANIYKTLLGQGVITLPYPTRAITSADLAQFGIVAKCGPETSAFRAFQRLTGLREFLHPAGKLRSPARLRDRLGRERKLSLRERPENPACARTESTCRCR